MDLLEDLFEEIFFFVYILIVLVEVEFVDYVVVWIIFDGIDEWVLGLEVGNWNRVVSFFVWRGLLVRDFFRFVVFVIGVVVVLSFVNFFVFDMFLDLCVLVRFGVGVSFVFVLFW